MSQVPPDLLERGWSIKSHTTPERKVLTKLFSFSDSNQFDDFYIGITPIQAKLRHHGELDMYQGDKKVRFSTQTHDTNSITERDFRLARQIETYYTNLMKRGNPQPALFLDFDGTVRGVVEDPARANKGGFRAPYHPDEVEVFPQVADILELWDDSGYFLVGATNQSGVGRGDLTETEAVACIDETVSQIGIGFPVCYSTAKKTADYKPAIGMGLEAIEKYGPFDLANSIMVGDNHRQGDENFAKNLGIQFVHANDFFHLTSEQQGRPNPFASETAPLHGETTEAPYQVKIYVPSTVRDTPISQEEHEARINDTSTFLAGLFGGYTSAEATGGYYSQDDGLISEPVVVVTSWANPEVYQKNKSLIEDFLKTKQKEWGQETIGFEFEDDFFMFPDFSAETEWFGNAQENIKKYVENYLKLGKKLGAGDMGDDYFAWLKEMASEFNVEKNKYFTCTSTYQAQKKQCYYNSLKYTWENPDAEYFEGWVVSSRLGIPIRHAWLVVDGNVYDPTFEIFRNEDDADMMVDYAYWGVLIPQMFITERIVATEKSGPYLFDYFFYTSPYSKETKENRHSRFMEGFMSEAKSKPYRVVVSRSTNDEKKLMAVFYDEEGDKIKTTHFGARGMSDYTKHKDKERMGRYHDRHKSNENWRDPLSAGALSKWILWNKPDLKTSFNNYKKRFNLKGEIKVKRS